MLKQGRHLIIFLVSLKNKCPSETYLLCQLCSKSIINFAVLLKTKTNRLRPFHHDTTPLQILNYFCDVIFFSFSFWHDCLLCCGDVSAEFYEQGKTPLRDHVHLGDILHIKDIILKVGYRRNEAMIHVCL